MEKRNKKDSSFCDKLGTLMACTDACFLEVRAHVLPKVATKDYFKDKQTMNI